MIDTNEPGNCRSCGAVIYWRVEKSGKRNPYNPPEPCKQCGADRGNVPAPDCRKCEGSGQMQASHFSTCKDAGRWRKR